MMTAPTLNSTLKPLNPKPETGIMAIFVGGVIMSHYTQWNLSDEARMVTASLFKTLAFAAETFLFAYIGLSAVTFSYDNAVALAMGAFVLCLIGRALNILPLSLIVNQFRTKKISMKVSPSPAGARATQRRNAQARG